MNIDPFWDSPEIEEPTPQLDIPDGEYDVSLTALEAAPHERFPGRPLTITAQFTIDNGPFRQQSFTDEYVLLFDGKPAMKTLGNIKSLVTASGFRMPSPFTTYTNAENHEWKNHVDLDTDIQERVLAQGDTPIRARCRVYHEYTVDGSKKDANGRWYSKADYDAAKAAGDKVYDRLKVAPGFAPPIAEAEGTYLPKVKASRVAGGDGLPASFGPQDPSTVTPETTPADTKPPF